jgi:hypothetical protein
METLTSRVKDIMLQPRRTWKEIDAEFIKPAELWGKYILPLAAIGPLFITISWLVFGKPVALTSLTNPVPIATAITRGLAEYVLLLLSVFVLALLLSAVAPTFGGQKNDVQALKAAAYSNTSAWLGGAFSLIQALWPVKWIFYVYTFVLLFIGLPLVMKVPSQQSVAYSAVGVIIGFAMFLLVRALLTSF